MSCEIYVGDIHSKEFKETYKSFNEFKGFKTYYLELLMKYDKRNIFINFTNLKECYTANEIELECNCCK